MHFFFFNPRKAIPPSLSLKTHPCNHKQEMVQQFSADKVYQDNIQALVKRARPSSCSFNLGNIYNQTGNTEKKRH